MSQLFIDITGYGSGPISTAVSWDWTWEIDRAGPISFPISASDRQNPYLDTDREVRAYILRDGFNRLDVGAGIVEQVGDEPENLGTVARSIDGSDLLIELANRSVRDLILSDGAGGPMAAVNIFTAIAAYLPAGWSITGTPSSAVYLKFAGESVLAALSKIVEQTGDHFILAGPTARQVTWLPKTVAPVSSGIRAIPSGEAIALEHNPRVCLIKSLKRVKDATGQYSRIYAYGAGNAEARLTLSGGTWAAPAGYTLDLTQNCLINDAADAIRRRDHYESFKDIGKSGNTATDTISAVNALRQAAYEELSRHLVAQQTYDLTVEKLDVPVQPGQTLRVVYKRWIQSRKVLDIDADLYILGVQTTIDDNGRMRTTGLTVSTIDKWPASDFQLIEGSVKQATSMEAHTQPAVSALTADSAGTVSAPVVARYTRSTTQALATATNVVVDFATLSIDTHSRVTTGAAWKFTAAVAGYYRVAVSILLASSTAFALGERGLLSLRKNSIIVSMLDRVDDIDSSVTAQFMRLQGEDLVFLAVNDTIDVTVNQNSGSSININADPIQNYISINKI
jgi:hypothetical protein